MDKIVRRRRYLDEWCIGETESWLSDMAAQGLHLESLGTVIVRFRRGEPEAVRYRVDFTNTEHFLDEEQRELYAQSGWEYVCDQKNSRIFRSPEASNAPEIHTDSAEQAYTLKKLSRRLTINNAVNILMPLIGIGMISIIFKFFGISILRFVEGTMMNSLIIYLIHPYLMSAQIQGAGSIRKLVRSMREGKAVDHNADWKKYKQRRVRFYIVYSIFCVLYIGVWGVTIAMHQVEPLPVVSDNQMHILAVRYRGGRCACIQERGQVSPRDI